MVVSEAEIVAALVLIAGYLREKTAPPPPTCPEGYVWNAAINQCVLIPPPPPPVDAEPPNTIIQTVKDGNNVSISSGGGTLSPSIAITFVGTDNKAIASFEGKIDADPYRPVASPLVFSNLTTGPHTVSIRAIDTAGNIDATPAIFPFTVLPPLPPPTSGKSPLWNYVPFYFQPTKIEPGYTKNNGQRVIDSAIANPRAQILAAINPNNGNDFNNTALINWVPQAKAAGIKVAGYVYLSNGARPLNEVLDRISRMKSVYGVQWIMFDESHFPDTQAVRDYVTQVQNYAASLGLNTKWNPGTGVPAFYQSMAGPAVWNIVESTTYPDTGAILANSGVIPVARRGATLHGLTAINPSWIANTAAKQLGMIYLQSVPPDANTYGYLSPYWENQVIECSKVPDTATPPPATGNDKFGVKMIYPTVTGGRTWTSKWDNGHARSFGDLPVKANDPDDPEFFTEKVNDAGQITGGLGNGTYFADGLGNLKITGVVPRMYVADKVKDWRNVEITVYGRRVSDNNTNYSGIKMVARSNHGFTNNENTQPCDNRGLAGAILNTGDALIEKETCHHCTAGLGGYAQVNRTQVFSGPNALPFNQWVGVKWIVRDSGATGVKMEIWVDRDATQNWVKVTEFTDTGFNFGVGYDSCGSSPSLSTPYVPLPSPALTLTSSNSRPGSETGRPNVSIYFRCDGVNQDGLWYKWASIREIAPI